MRHSDNGHLRYVSHIHHVLSHPHPTPQRQRQRPFCVHNAFGWMDAHVDETERSRERLRVYDYVCGFASVCRLTLTIDRPPYCKYPVCSQMHPSVCIRPQSMDASRRATCVSSTHPPIHPPTASHHATLQTARHTPHRPLNSIIFLCLWCGWVLRTPPTHTNKHGAPSHHTDPQSGTHNTREERQGQRRLSCLVGRSVGRSVGQKKERRTRHTHIYTPEKQDGSNEVTRQRRKDHTRSRQTK